MDVVLDEPVTCTDGAPLEVVDAVVDPRTRTVTNVVIRPHRASSLARLVPVQHLEEHPGGLRLALDLQAFNQLPMATEVAFVRLDELPSADVGDTPGSERVAAFPYVGAGPSDRVTVIRGLLPEGNVELRRKSRVVTPDGRIIGRVDALRCDGDDAITAVLVRTGRVFGRRQVAIPIAQVDAIADDTVTISIPKAVVRDLPRTATAIRVA